MSVKGEGEGRMRVGVSELGLMSVHLDDDIYFSRSSKTT